MPTVVTTPYTGDGHTSSGSAWAGFGKDVIEVAHVSYDFNVDGGVISTITPKTTSNLPDNAIIIGSLFNSSTAPVGASATVAFGTAAGSSSSSLLGATAITSFTADAVLNGIGAAAPFKMTARGAITMTIATTALTAGRIEGWVYYIVSPT